MTIPEYDLTIVGGGAVGLAIAYRVAQQLPGLKLLLLEKEAQLAAHQTGHNSGVLHSGIYYKPGSSKARNCIQGREELIAFAAAHGIAHEVCGKVVVAVEEAELPYLDKIYATSLQNGLPLTRRINPTELKELEPNCRGIAALHVPYTGIIDYPAVCRALAAEVVRLAPNAQLLTQQQVLGIKAWAQGLQLTTQQATYRTRFLITAAGLQADRLARMQGLTPPASIVGFRGDYYDLTPAARSKVRNIIYPVPNPTVPFLGVHFTRMVNGTIECGPNAVFTFKREGYLKTDFNLTDTLAALSYPGTWRLFASHWRFGLGEYRRAFSKRAFLRQIQRLVPSIQASDLVPGRAGVRAMALGKDGAMLDDFLILPGEHSLHVLNAPSPAATACLALAQDVVQVAMKQFGFD